MRPCPRPAAEGNGTTLLYPAYSFVRLPGAVKYEVEILDTEPEEERGFAPSAHRIFSAEVENPELFDPSPRFGTHWWRVRGVDEKGNPVGEWSPAVKISSDTKTKIAAFGDSITHGGANMSASPADKGFSFLHYLSFDVVNLGKSGDSAAQMLARFDADVLPFRPKTLLILGGTNSLRMGFGAGTVIAEISEMEKKCEANGIQAIFLTIPPINPALIETWYHQPTAPDWEEQFARVNEWIRTRRHIDTAAAFPAGPMAEELAADGLHPGWKAKKMMAEKIEKELKGKV